MAKECRECAHWHPTDYDMGECSEINDKITVEIVAGWDGGYVKSIETDADFGCVLFNGEQAIK